MTINVKAAKLLIGAIFIAAAGIYILQLATTNKSVEKAAEQQVSATDENVAISETQAEPANVNNQAGQTDVHPAQSEEVLDQVAKNLEEQLPGVEFSSLTESTIPGLYEVVTQGQIYYISETAQYLIDGSLIRLSDRTNLTESKLGSIQISMVNAIEEQDMLIYEPETPSDRAITVFTDISCGFCRRLHAELDTLLENGVRVRYLLFPRAGLGSQGHKDLESVWCADNPQEAMTIAKAGGEIVPASCENPIESHVALAQEVGLRGTPLIFTDSGEKIPGYREAAALSTMVNDSEPVTR